MLDRVIGDLPGTNVTEDGTITPDKSVILKGKRLHTGELPPIMKQDNKKIVVKMAHIEAPYYGIS